MWFRMLRHTRIRNDDVELWCCQPSAALMRNRQSTAAQTHFSDTIVNRTLS